MRCSPTALASLRALAATQHGAFCPDQALACGWSEASIDRARRDGSWHRVTRGAYADAALWEALSPNDRHLCALHARLLVLPDGWHAAVRSAALAHELPFLGKPPARPQLVRARISDSDRGRLAQERISPLPPEERVLVRRLPASSLARTTCDVARADGFRAGVVVADAALRRGLRPAVLQRAADRQAGWRGAAVLGRVVAFADPRSESALESISRVYLDDWRLPRPEPQAEVYLGEELLARVDFCWPEQPTIGESDGRIKYLTGQDLFAEKRREDRLRALGFQFVRWDWDDVWSGDGALAAEVRAKLALGSRHALAPGVRIVATSLARLEHRPAA